MLVGEFQRQDGTLDDVIEEEKEDTEGNQGPSARFQQGAADDERHTQNSGRRRPGFEERAGDMNIVEKGKPGGYGVKQEREVKENDPGLRQQPLHQSEIPGLVTLDDGLEIDPPEPKKDGGQHGYGDDFQVFLYIFRAQPLDKE